jgi:hypothetical protein
MPGNYDPAAQQQFISDDSLAFVVVMLGTSFASWSFSCDVTLLTANPTAKVAGTSEEVRKAAKIESRSGTAAAEQRMKPPPIQFGAQRMEYRCHL